MKVKQRDVILQQLFQMVSDIWHTPNHWANSETSLIRLVQNIAIPYIRETRKKLDLNEEHMALVIYDTFKGHTGEEMKSILVQNNVISVIVPANCTDLLQPLDLSVNKPFKDHLRHCFQSWYSNQVFSQLQGVKKAEDITIDTKLCVMKPLGSKWLLSAYDYIRSQSDIILVVLLPQLKMISTSNIYCVCY